MFDDDVLDNSEPASPDPRVVAAEKDPAYSKADDPRHGEAVHRVREAYQQAEAPPGEPAKPEDPDNPVWGSITIPHVDDAARLAGADRPTLPAPLAETWDTDTESDIYVWSAEEGISGSTISAIVSDWADFLVVGGRMDTGLREGDEQMWSEKLTQEYRLTDRQAKRLAAYVKMKMKGE